METFGRVYLRTKTGDDFNNLVLVPSARFSNLDHKWYDSEKMIHPEFEKHRGKEFSLHFKIQQRDKNGVLVPFEGYFQLPLRLGEMGIQDIEGARVAEKQDQELVRGYNLISTDRSTDEITKGIAQAAFLAACFPNQKLKDSKIHRIFLLAFFRFDDDLEAIRKDLRFHELKNLMKIMDGIFNGKSVNLDDINPSALGFPNTMMKYLKYMQMFEIELSKAEKENKISGNYIREYFREYLEGVCLENCVEWKKQPYASFVETNTELRVWVGAARVCFELALFDAKIDVNPEIRKTFLFQWLITLYTKQTCLVNDLVSFRKETEAGHGGGCNRVYLLHYAKGLPLGDAMQQVLDETNNFTIQLVETACLLSQLYSDDEHVLRFAQKANEIVYGHIQWLTFSERYHKNFVYDCVLEY
ncbi:unnamed protein product [Orchesella dallaii]|uniref:Uncharacterized protein n=1 Tax=Orchesella dallaii TaxID=48710 RepID=A0ABP1RQZ2_9HEXA